MEEFDAERNGNDINGANLLARVRLAEFLEGAAQNFSEGYREGYEDGCHKAVGDSDFGCELETTLSFEVERLREEHRQSMYGEPVIATYTTTSFVKRKGLGLSNIPDFVQDYVCEMDDYDLEDLEEPGLVFALGYVVIYTLTSDGEFEYDDRMSVYVGDNEIELSKDILMQAHDVDVDGEAEPVLVDDDLAEVIGADDLALFQKLGQTILAEHSTHTLVQFCDQLPSVRHASEAQHYERMANIVTQIFATQPLA